MFKNNLQKGAVAIYLVLIIMALVLAISLGLSSILVRQIQMVEGLEDSNIANYAAFTGLEYELYKTSPTSVCTNYTNSINGAEYKIEIVEPADGSICPDSFCPSAGTECVVSTGKYGTAQRRILMPR